MNEVKRFFWICSGSHHPLLEKNPSEASKYAGIGATIFFTGLFAALASGYALYTVFDQVWAAMLFGLVWGLMIFNLDRYIVSSMRKKEGIWSEFKMASPRIVLAILIAVVISKPLELKIFEKEVETELVSMNEEISLSQEHAVQERYRPKKEALLAQEVVLKQEILEMEANRNALSEIARQEADGTGGTKRRNAGPIYRIKKADADQADQELAALRERNLPQIAENQKKQQNLDSAMNAELAALEQGTFSGFAARIEALDRLGERHASIWWANLFILFLFMMIESAPVLVKLISEKSPYDYELGVIEYAKRNESVESVARLNQELRQRTENIAGPERSYLDRKMEEGLNGA